MTTICCFGDSITYGASDTQKDGWVSRLREKIQIDYDATVYNCGVCGDTVQGLSQRIEVESVLRKPDIGIFAIGINDSCYQDFKELDILKFENQYRTLLQRAKIHIKYNFVLGLTPVNEKETYPWKFDITLYDNTIKKIAKELDIKYISMLDVFSLEDLEDGLHPNSNGHQKMFKKIRDVLSKLF